MGLVLPLIKSVKECDVGFRYTVWGTCSVGMLNDFCLNGLFVTPLGQCCQCIKAKTH